MKNWRSVPLPAASGGTSRLDWHRSVFGGWTASALFDFEAEKTAGQPGAARGSQVRLARLPGAH